MSPNIASNSFIFAHHIISFVQYKKSSHRYYHAKRTVHHFKIILAVFYQKCVGSKSIKFK